MNFGTPSGCYGKISLRSSLIKEHFVTVDAGVIDSDFRGCINVLIINHLRNDFIVHIGQRIAQIVFHKCEDVKFIKTKTLSETERGIGSFGSTGKFICCTHSMQTFLYDNSEQIIHIGSSFRCCCRPYGTTQIYFCFCPHCLRDTQCNGNLDGINCRFHKYCVNEDDIKKLIFRGSYRFLNSRETKAPIFFSVQLLKFVGSNGASFFSDVYNKKMKNLLINHRLVKLD